jgi:hypothetical protein
VLELKEEGTPVAEGAEIELELELRNICAIAWQGHVTLNDAVSDEVTVEPGKKSCGTQELYSTGFVGSGIEVAMTSHGKATVGGSVGWSRPNPRQVAPDEYCGYELSRLSGRFPNPGHADTRVSGRGALSGEYRRGAPKCSKKSSLALSVRILGHNGKPLETELVG